VIYMMLPATDSNSQMEPSQPATQYGSVAEARRPFRNAIEW
jgi:hypothetical protein